MRGIDLSCWRVAINGAEPVRAQTLHKFAATFEPFGFRPSAFNPCYGMAEATLLISGGQRGVGPCDSHRGPCALAGRSNRPAVRELDEVAIVGCGKALRRRRDRYCRSGNQAPACSGLCWRDLGPGTSRCRRLLAQRRGIKRDVCRTDRQRGGAPLVADRRPRFHRFGGELFVTGRIKDIIIVRGANHYPQDIEYTVQATDPCLRAGYGAAFAALATSGMSGSSSYRRWKGAIALARCRRNCRPDSRSGG